MESLQEKIDKALDLINNDEYTLAQKELKEVLSEEPDNVDAIKNLALCEVNLDNPIEAISLFKKAVLIDENDATSYFYLANCLSKIGEKEDAISNLERVIELRPDFIDVYKSLAMIKVEFGQIDEAIELLSKALKDTAIEADYTFYYIFATCYMLKKDNIQAIKYLELALELNPEHLPIMNSLSSCYMGINEYQKAQKVLSQAFELDNNNALTAYNLGVLYQSCENYNEALKYFQISYQIEPSVTMMSSLANCALKSGEYMMASVIYQNLVMLYPNNPEYRYSYIECLEATSQYNEALNNVNNLLSVDQKNIDLIKKKGSLLRKLGFCEEAIETLKLLLNRGKIDVEIYYNLAYSYVQIGDFDNAKEMFKKCIILEPNNPYAHKDLGVLYLKMNCYDWAVDEMLEAIELEDDIAEFYYSLGVAYLMLSNISDGKKALLKASELDSSDPDILAFLGYTYMLEHDNDKAQIALQKALEIAPDNFLAKSHSAKYYFQVKKYDIAKQFLLDIIEQVQDDETMNMLGICYLVEENYHDAMGIFHKLVLNYPKNHILLTNLAKCEYNCDKKQEANEHLRQALMIFDDYKEALDLLEEINNGK
ncbi:MAG: tetratricopeptide repeat protein [Candidatus Gastranaerophilales bacterium]|nr:tetratricopeptide repeat protein [Candidatus Gastranaerophilales bacterium]